MKADASGMEMIFHDSRGLDVARVPTVRSSAYPPVQYGMSVTAIPPKGAQFKRRPSSRYSCVANAIYRNVSNNSGAGRRRLEKGDGSPPLGGSYGDVGMAANLTTNNTERMAGQHCSWRAW